MYITLNYHFFKTNSLYFLQCREKNISRCQEIFRCTTQLTNIYIGNIVTKGSVNLVFKHRIVGKSYRVMFSY